MNIDKMTIKQIKELSRLLSQHSEGATITQPAGDNSAWEIGGNYLIRTVTMINTGRLVAVTSQELVIEGAAWVADTGGFSDSLKTSDFNEVEPYPTGRVIVGRGSVVDAVIIGTLPLVKK